MLELAKEALDEVALAIDVGIDDTPDADVGLAWDVGFCPVGFDPLNDCPGKEAAIGDDIAGHRSAPEKVGLIGGLAGRQDEADRKPNRIHHRVDLGAQSFTRTTDGVIRALFLPPAACW